jgi:hypothetical protein
MRARVSSLIPLCAFLLFSHYIFLSSSNFCSLFLVFVPIFSFKFRRFEPLLPGKQGQALLRLELSQNPIEWLR